MTYRIETVNYNSSMARDLSTFFADLVDGVPHCRSLTPDEIDFAVGGNERRKNRRIQPEVKLVAVSGSEVVGLALIGPGTHRDLEAYRQRNCPIPRIQTWMPTSWPDATQRS